MQGGRRGLRLNWSINWQLSVNVSLSLVEITFMKLLDLLKPNVLAKKIEQDHKKNPTITYFV